MTSALRVRFAPAPSGVLHVGSARSALYNWLVARQQGGTFILRIEDTDASRATEESMNAMAEALRWLGLDWDEGIEVGGPYGPYRQSERVAFHRAVIRRLLDRGDAYEDFATTDELEAHRQTQRDQDRPPVIKGPVRGEPRPGESDDPSIRLRTPGSGDIAITDVIRGDITFDWATIGDFVIQRSDGSPTYPLANSADDVAQGLTLICRGEDLLSVTPRQVLLYDLLLRDGLLDEALDEAGLPGRADGWEAPTRFAHLPLIVGEDRQKLSKRHGSVAVQEFAAQGYLPEVMVNYLSLLGWAPGDGRERLGVDELVELFDLSSVNRTAAAFDVDKMTAFNGERIRQLSEDELADRLLPFLDGTYGDPVVSDPPSDDERETLRGLVPLVQERMQRLDEIQHHAPPFFRDDLDLDPEAVKKVLSKTGAVTSLEAAGSALGDLDGWTTDAIEERLRGLVDELDLSTGKVFQPIRVAVTGSRVSPPLFESLELLGRDRSLARIQDAIPVAREAGGD
ncbi:MAG: glutamate--tRNA ligase [Actinobacteria bacterium]|nr:glutamate--tRNA ligase [Actinomycetota bacterium]